MPELSFFLLFEYAIKVKSHGGKVIKIQRIVNSIASHTSSQLTAIDMYSLPASVVHAVMSTISNFTVNLLTSVSDL